MTQHLDVKTGDKFRSANKQNSIVGATVVDVFFDKVAIQLSGSGTYMRGLKLIGGPVKAGDSVQVDFSTTPPMVIAKGNAYLSLDDLEAALKRIAPGLTGGKTRIDIILFSGGGVVQMFTPTIEGLNSAILAAGSGDLIVFPDIDITANITVPQGVALSGLSSRQSIIRGTITLNQDCTLENLCVIQMEDTTEEVNAVIAQGAGLPSWIKGCEIHAYNCGTGLATAIKIQTNTNLLQVTDSVVVADSKLGANAHAFVGAGGTCKVMNCKLYSKSTDHFNGTTFYEYSDVGHVSEIDRACVPVLSEMYQMIYSSTDPFTDRSRAAWEPPTVTVAKSVTGSANNWKYFCHTGQYIYFGSSVGNTDQKVLQYRLSDGNIDEHTIWTWATNQSGIIGLIAYDEDKIYVLADANSVNGYKIQVYFNNFETGELGLYYEHDRTHGGDLETDIGVKYLTASSLVPVKNEVGDLFMVVCGAWRRAVDDTNNVYDAGPFFFKKNITQDEAWSRKISDDPIIPLNISTKCWLYDPVLAVVQNRYIGATATFQMGDGSSAIGMWSFDTETDLIISDYIHQYPSYGGFTPTPVELQGNNEDGKFYLRYGDDYDVTNNGYPVIYDFDPTIGVFAEYIRAAENISFLLLSGKQGLFLWQSPYSAANVTIKNLSTLATLLSAVNHPVPEGNFLYSNFINESNEVIFYLRTQGTIRLWGLDDNNTDDITGTGIEGDTTIIANKIRQLIGCYVIWGNKWTGTGIVYNNKAWVIKET